MVQVAQVEILPTLIKAVGVAGNDRSAGQVDDNPLEPEAGLPFAASSGENRGIAGCGRDRGNMRKDHRLHIISSTSPQGQQYREQELKASQHGDLNDD